MTLKEFGDLLKTIEGVKAWHYRAERQEYPYIIYTELYQHHLRAENKIKASYDVVQVSYFTKKRFDGTVDVIWGLLNDNEISFDYKVIYESENKVVHHLFDCSLL